MRVKMSERRLTGESKPCHRYAGPKQLAKPEGFHPGSEEEATVGKGAEMDEAKAGREFLPRALLRQESASRGFLLPPRALPVEGFLLRGTGSRRRRRRAQGEPRGRDAPSAPGVFARAQLHPAPAPLPRRK